jgi:putative hydrolase of the HAD superfamily
VKYRGVVFDLWQTLAPWPTESANAMYLQMADVVGADRERFKAAWWAARPTRETGPIVDNVRAILRELEVDSEPDELLAIRRAWIKESLVPRPGALETLAELRRRGHRLGLITVCSQDVVYVWDETPFAGLFDETVFSCEVGVLKPDPRIYQLCCERLGVPLQESLFVGDGANDELPGAERVGMTAVQLRAPGEELTPPGKEWQGAAIESLDEVLDLV